MGRLPYELVARNIRAATVWCRVGCDHPIVGGVSSGPVPPAGPSPCYGRARAGGVLESRSGRSSAAAFWKGVGAVLQLRRCVRRRSRPRQ
jgi:hypothetical protein